MNKKYVNKEHWTYQAYLDAIERELATRVRLTLSLKDHIKEQLKKRAQILDSSKKSVCTLLNCYLDPQEVKRLYACEQGVYSGITPLIYQGAFWRWEDLYPEAWEDFKSCERREPGFLKRLWLIAAKLHLQYAYHMIKKEAENGENPEE